MAVLAIAPANRVGRRDKGRPYRGRRTLRHGLEAKLRRLIVSGAETQARPHLLHQLRRHMAPKFSLDSARMQRGCAHAASLKPAIESHRVEDVCGLRTAVCGKRLIRSPLEIRIVKIDIAQLMTRRRKSDDSSARFEQGQEPIDEHEVPQVIGSELRLEAVMRL